MELTDNQTIDLTDSVMEDNDFTRPALGILLTSEQVWYSHGLALGNLLHSLTLAPGEVTRVAVTDWSRTTKGKRGEKLDQKEDVSMDSDLKRAISEVTNATAKETQREQVKVVRTDELTEKYG